MGMWLVLGINKVPGIVTKSERVCARTSTRVHKYYVFKGTVLYMHHVIFLQWFPFCD
jgi:hypothetical protein